MEQRNLLNKKRGGNNRSYEDEINTKIVCRDGQEEANKKTFYGDARVDSVVHR
jgi:hypothetical protein